MDAPEEGDWPPVEGQGAETWAQALGKLDRTQQQLIEIVSALTDSKLKERVANKEYSIGFMLQGIIQHNVYHTGQIALLKKVRTHQS